MKNGRCPQCGSTEVHSAPGGMGFGNQSELMLYIKTRGRPSTTTACVCTQCGHFEVFLTSTGMLQEVAQNWSKVPVR